MIIMPSVPVKQWVCNSFKVHKRVLAIKMKNLHLAVASRVIDDKQVHSIICKHVQKGNSSNRLNFLSIYAVPESKFFSFSKLEMQSKVLNNQKRV